MGATAKLSIHEENDEESLIWAALEKLPTYDRLRKSVLKSLVESDDNMNKVVNKVVDVRKLNVHEREEFIDRVLKVTEEDNERFLRKLRNRIDEAGIELHTVEVRFENLTVKVDCLVGERALPTLPNAARNIAETALSCFGIKLTQRAKLKILNDVSGILKPSRMTLLLGPPSSGKTTLLLALAGRLSPSLKESGEITYNGHKLNEFDPEKTAVYVSQSDVHVAEMTLGETLEFSARCQGVGSRYELLKEVTSREKETGLVPDADVDLFMKAIAMDGGGSSLITDYVLKILGLTECRDTIVGDQMKRGISGGQKKRFTTAPETFNLFDDIVLLSEGQTVYHGPREHVLKFFESCGFKCPERKELLISCKSFDKEWLLIKRNSFFYVFKTVQIIIVAMIASTVFLRTKLHARNEEDGAVYVGL
ncbi:UNVERIFIED_CONTAM: ABC transporter G family member 35 [Sesamum angustifolium]|uniref:ABC transporter G family member 35 n=1 Tax=Sesamum angustifolium TaxID=2727405 RepID=A0AAW2LNK6_9LAMI